MSSRLLARLLFRLIVLCAFASGCSSLPKAGTGENPLDGKAQTSAAEVEKSPLLLRATGYGASVPLAGTGYVLDGGIYVLGGTSIIAISCAPIFLGVALASATSPSIGTRYAGAAAQPACFPVPGLDFKTLERFHPHLGPTWWRATESWRN